MFILFQYLLKAIEERFPNMFRPQFSHVECWKVE
jgi:hypothetical protein